MKLLVIQLCLTLCDPVDPGLLCPWNSSGKNTGVGSHPLLQGIFLTRGSNPGLLHCRQIFDCQSHQESPRALTKTPANSHLQTQCHGSHPFLPWSVSPGDSGFCVSLSLPLMWMPGWINMAGPLAPTAPLLIPVAPAVHTLRLDCLS